MATRELELHLERRQRVLLNTLDEIDRLVARADTPEEQCAHLRQVKPSLGRECMFVDAQYAGAIPG
jgi:hypothetical protein